MTTLLQRSATAACKPILKWAGGKRQLLPELLPRVPGRYRQYIEPFFGGGALFFALRPKRAVIADANPELINLYTIVRDQVEALIDQLQDFQTDKETFYEVRAWLPEELTQVEQAARTIYLNRTCFNGLFRVNRRGEFNVPYGRYKNPRVCDADNLRAAAEALSGTKIICGDYLQVLRRHAKSGDFVFLDPPYLPISQYSDFKRYTPQQFHQADHERLAAEARQLVARGCHLVLTNSNHKTIRQLYSGFDQQVVATRRNINKNGNARRGEDLIVAAAADRHIRATGSARATDCDSEQVAKYPATRFMGSKSALLSHIWEAASQFQFETAADLFSGSGIVAYLLKSHGKQVLANDHLAMAAATTRSLIENNSVRLSQEDVEFLLKPATRHDRFVEQNFGGLYFSDAENRLIDTVRANLRLLTSPTKQAIARAALVRACVKKRPRGIFTYTGQRYDDGRRDLRMSLQEQFAVAIQAINQAVFSNGQRNKSRRGDALTVPTGADLVYIDPPYYSPHSDNEYVRRYHFVEGIACDWQGVTMQWETKTRKFRAYPTPFRSRVGAEEALEQLFARHRESIQIVSYSSNSLPTRKRMVELMAKHKHRVDVVQIDHRYSFGTQGHKVNDNKNRVKEFLFVGSD